MAPEQIAAELTKAQRECLLDLPKYDPWPMGSPGWLDHDCRMRFYNLGLVEAVFPEAVSGNSGRQLWRFNALGLQVRQALLDQEKKS